MGDVHPGCFVVLEGGEGSGKSTQARLLAARLRADGHDVVETFEPGATTRGARLRAALLDDHSALDERSELLLLVADRAQHVTEVIAPALARGAVVVCDRHSPSTLTYQGVGRGLGIEVAEAADRIAVGDLRPDVVVVLDVDAATAAARRPDATDRMEAAGRQFHDIVRAAYRDLAPDYDWRLIDGRPDTDTVAAAVWAAVAPVVSARAPR